MAWIIKRKRKRKRRGRGKPWLHVQWRDADGKVHSESLRTTDMRVALVEQARIEAEVEKKADVLLIVPAAEALERFLAYLDRREQLRPASVQVYRERLEPLFAAHGRLPLARWTREMLGEYLDQHKGWSPRTKQLTVNACKRFIVWCREDASIECSDFVKRNKGLVPAVPLKADHEVFSMTEITRLMKEVRGEPHGNRWIDLAVNLAFWAALPFGDIRTLEWRHIDLKEGTLKKRRQKTNEQIAVPIAEPLRRVLQRNRRITGLVVPYLPASGSSTRKSLVRKVEKAGIPKRQPGQGGWHLLRHSMGTALDCAGARMSSISLILGHRAATMTGRYIHASLTQAREGVTGVEEAFRRARLECLRPRLEASQRARQAV